MPLGELIYIPDVVPATYRTAHLYFPILFHSANQADECHYINSSRWDKAAHSSGVSFIEGSNQSQRSKMFRRTKKTSKGHAKNNNGIGNGSNGVNDFHEKFSNFRGVHILREPHINKVGPDLKYIENTNLNTKKRCPLQEYCDFFCLMKALLAFFYE